MAQQQQQQQQYQQNLPPTRQSYRERSNNTQLPNILKLDDDFAQDVKPKLDAIPENGQSNDGMYIL